MNKSKLRKAFLSFYSAKSRIVPEGSEEMDKQNTARPKCSPP